MAQGFEQVWEEIRPTVEDQIAWHFQRLFAATGLEDHSDEVVAAFRDLVEALFRACAASRANAAKGDR